MRTCITVPEKVRMKLMQRCVEEAEEDRQGATSTRVKQTNNNNSSLLSRQVRLHSTHVAYVSHKIQVPVCLCPHILVSRLRSSVAQLDGGGLHGRNKPSHHWVQNAHRTNDRPQTSSLVQILPHSLFSDKLSLWLLVCASSRNTSIPSPESACTRFLLRGACSDACRKHRVPQDQLCVRS